MSDWLRELLLDTASVMERPSRYKADLAYWVDGREIAHFEDDDLLDVRLTQAVIRRHRRTLEDDPRVELRGRSDWAMVRATGPQDGDLVTQMVQWAIEANRRI